MQTHPLGTCMGVLVCDCPEFVKVICMPVQAMTCATSGGLGGTPVKGPPSNHRLFAFIQGTGVYATEQVGNSQCRCVIKAMIPIPHRATKPLPPPLFKECFPFTACCQSPVDQVFIKSYSAGLLVLYSCFPAGFNRLFQVERASVKSR